MQVSETWAKVLGGALASVALVAALVFVSTVIPPNHVHAQGAGTVGIYTVEIPVFTNQATSAVSAVLPDNGFAAHYLRYCPAAWTGTVSFEWAPNGVASNFFLPLKTALVISGDSQCHTLQLGGFYPNLRARIVTQAAGTISAWYTASSAPIPYFAPTIATGGDSSIVSCDQSKTATVASGASGFLAGPVLTGINTFYLRLCGATISFAAAPGATGTVSFAWDIDNTCASTPNINWTINTTATTPQVIPLPNLNLGSLPANGLPQQFLCLANASGQSLKVNYNYALISASSQ